MEKYSAFRDPGTGIQPFLTPVPPIESETLARLAVPLGYILGILRTFIVLVLGLIYLLLVRGVCLVLIPVPALYRHATHALTALIARLVLFLVGLWWLPVEPVTRKHGRGIRSTESWNPSAGDIIVSNWVSWIEILWLAFRFNPIFVLPITEAVPMTSPISVPSPRPQTPGRRTGTGSANISSPTRPPSTRGTVLGFHQISLLSMLRLTGRVPPYGTTILEKPNSLNMIQRTANRPIVVFPECTTSNGRAMLRFADIFRGESVPTKGYKVFVMCVRYDPPTALTPTPTHSIPSHNLNPLPHLFTLTTAISPLSISIRLLAPSDSPSSPLFMVSEVINGSVAGDDPLSESCAALIAQIGKVKRTGMGWEDKAAFLDFYRGKRR